MMDMFLLLGQTPDPVAIPDIGVNVAGTIQSAATALGAIALVAVVSYVAFMLVKKGMRWMNWGIK